MSTSKFTKKLTSTSSVSVYLKLMSIGTSSVHVYVQIYVHVQCPMSSSRHTFASSACLRPVPMSMLTSTFSSVLFLSFHVDVFVNVQLNADTYTSKLTFTSTYSFHFQCLRLHLFSTRLKIFCNPIHAYNMAIIVMKNYKYRLLESITNNLNYSEQKTNLMLLR